MLNATQQPQQPAQQLYSANPDINFFGLANFRNLNRKFGIKTDDRRRHMYVVGKTGMGKTTLMENMVLNDIYAGHGVGLVDPHGDFAEKIINFIPPKRINDVVYFNPADINYPIGFNILETFNPDHKHLVAAGLMGIFKKIWIDMWSSRMEYILNNTILALLDFPGTTLLGINRMLADAAYRRRIVRNVKDPVVKAFWLNEFASYNERYAQEAVAPIQNKIGQFLSASVIRNIVAQVKSRINIREIMDNKKIFIMNLSKGRIGEDNSRLLGGMLITKLQLSAMERVDTPESDRKDFFLYVDEFQNFATESFANILSEARKYRLSLIMAHQYMEQLDEEVLAAVVGNVGSILTFRVGSTDADVLTKEFTPTFIETDLINLTKYNIFLKLMIDGVASRPFSALTLPPVGSATDSSDKVIRVSRERYAVQREKIEDKIARWSGMEIIGEESASEDEENVDLDGSLDGDDLLTIEEQKQEQKKPEKKLDIDINKNIKKQEVNFIRNQLPQTKDKVYIKETKPQFTNYQGSRNNKNKNKNKKKDNPPNFRQGEKVFLTDPQQKGISLQTLLPKQEQKPIEKNQASLPPINPINNQNYKSPASNTNNSLSKQTDDQHVRDVKQGRVVKFD